MRTANDASLPAADALLYDEDLPAAARTTIGAISVDGASLNDVLRALGERYEVNIVSDPTITEPVTLRLSGISVAETLVLLAERYDLQVERRGSVFYVSWKIFEEPPPDIRLKDGLLYARLSGVPLVDVAKALQTSANLSLIVRPGTQGTLSGHLSGVPILEGLRTLLETNGYLLRDEGGVLIVEPDPAAAGEGGLLRVEVRDSLISLEAREAELSAVLRALGRESGANVVLVGDLSTTRITARFSAKEIDDVLSHLLANTPVRFRKEDDTYLIGETAEGGSWTSRLLRLRHARASDVLELLPAEVLGRAKAVVVAEQNAILAYGSFGDVARIEEFIAEIDVPMPQILIEALVVDFETTDLSELGVTVGRGAVPDSSLYQRFSLFGGGADQSGGLIYQGDGAEANSFVGYWKDLLGVGVGRLPDDFVFRIRALEREGKAKVVSRPQIATLNGHTASLSIGTTQYFILKSTTPLQSPNQIITQESERFERIEANVRLEITPWVNEDGQVTVEVHPEFSTPVGQLNPEVPPTINSRVLDSTVRLRDGETIILGGLIQQTRVATYNKVPILGDIPLLGRLFRNRSEQDRTSELIIYVTPHIFYGDGEEGERWERIRKRIGATEVEGVSFRKIEILDEEAAP